MANIPTDYPISARDAYLILVAGAHVALDRKAYETAAAITAIKEKIMELPEYDTMPSKEGDAHGGDELQDGIQGSRT